MKLLKSMISSVVLLLALLAFVGCAQEKEASIDDPTSSISEAFEEAVIDVVKEEVKKEDKEETEEVKAEGQEKLTKREEEIIEDLTKLGAEKYGVSVEAYTDTLKSQGLTPYTAQKQLADTMGISLEELHAYETANVAQLTDEQKENNANMANALEEVSNLDLSDMEGLTAESILGMKTNEGGEIIALEGDVDELFSYELKELLATYDDEYSHVVEYYSDGTVEETVNYFDELLNNTEEYFFLGQDIQVGAYITGRVNGMLMTVAVEPLEEGLYVTYYLDKTTKE